MPLDLTRLTFAGTAASPAGFLRDGTPQIAFAGRSNAGKSSVINRLANRKALARVGAAPGKTRQINYFRLGDALCLADLPGYGYARVSDAERRRWGELMEAYFASGLITAGALVVDARHAPTADDVKMARWFRDAGRPVAVVANKVDKLKRSEVEPNLLRIREALPFDDGTPVVAFSAEKGTGREELIAWLSGLAG